MARDSTFKKGRVPLVRAISKLGISSRNEAESLIVAGRVKVHGKVEMDPKRMVNPDSAHIEIDGEKASKEEPQIFIFHKPVGVLTTKKDPEGRKTIYELLPPELQSFHAVGRLDMNTSGLLLLTNHTKWSNFLTDPQNAVERVYIVTVKGSPIDVTLHKMIEGIEDEGEILSAKEVRVQKQSAKESRLRIVLTQGKNREIRRLCKHFDHEVISLKRVSYGEFELGDLPLGQVKVTKSTKLV